MGVGAVIEMGRAGMEAQGKTEKMMKMPVMIDLDEF